MMVQHPLKVDVGVALYARGVCLVRGRGRVRRQGQG